MDQCEAFLKKTECHFNWHLSQLDVNHSQPILVRLKDRLDEKSAVSDASSNNKWPLQLTYGYELSSEDPEGALKCVEETIQEIVTSEEALNVKYRVPFLHIASSTKAYVMLKMGSNLRKVEQIIGLIKPKSNMSDSELAGLLAMKAQILRYYGPDGTTKGLPLLREAVRRNREEVEWKISLVVSLNRKRHFFKGSDVKWDQVEEPVDILDELLRRSDLTEKQTVECKYYLAVAYYDYVMAKPQSADTKSCKNEILRLCSEIQDKTDFPAFLSFCAERFAESGPADKRRGLRIIKNLLEKFPNSVSINITACKILKRQGDLATAAKHAQVALDNGCYGGAWLWLHCKTKLNEEFDADEFFRKILQLFQKMYRKQTHLNASMYYFFVKEDPVYGAYHMEQALAEDPDFDAVRKPFFAWYLHGCRIRPIEVAYNQIVWALRTNHSNEDFTALNSAKIKIEQVTDAKGFPTSRNLVEEALRESRPHKPTNRRFHGRR